MASTQSASIYIGQNLARSSDEGGLTPRGVETLGETAKRQPYWLMPRVIYAYIEKWTPVLAQYV